jgi:hypothetical protein
MVTPYQKFHTLLSLSLSLSLSLTQIAPPLKVRDPSTNLFFTNPPPINDRERPNDRLVTDEPVEFEDFGKVTYHFERGSIEYTSNQERKN